ncbi:hypothetical protein [Burkholderia aenigmatica]|uniref:hypothetical protein n=1 Tax=Burkholderia aenigmatica TaxID=2015348 RepID=UPI0015835DE8|nr:hypothetical protein [Burkholderia aenigmatica]
MHQLISLFDTDCPADRFKRRAVLNKWSGLSGRSAPPGVVTGGKSGGHEGGRCIGRQPNLTRQREALLGKHLVDGFHRFRLSLSAPIRDWKTCSDTLNAGCVAPVDDYHHYRQINHPSTAFADVVSRREMSTAFDDNARNALALGTGKRLLSYD